MDLFIWFYFASVLIFQIIRKLFRVWGRADCDEGGAEALWECLREVLPQRGDRRCRVRLPTAGGHRYWGVFHVSSWNWRSIQENFRIWCSILKDIMLQNWKRNTSFCNAMCWSHWVNWCNVLWRIEYLTECAWKSSTNLRGTMTSACCSGRTLCSTREPSRVLSSDTRWRRPSEPILVRDLSASHVSYQFWWGIWCLTC